MVPTGSDRTTWFPTCGSNHQKVSNYFLISQCITTPPYNHHREMTTKRKSAEETKNTGGAESRNTNFRTTSPGEESLHRMKREYKQMLLVLDNTRKEKSDVIQQAGSEITRLREEKDNVIKQSVDEITRLRRELGCCNQVVERIGSHMRKQADIIEYLRMSLAKSESFNSSRDPFNHVGAF